MTRIAVVALLLLTAVACGGEAGGGGGGGRGGLVGRSVLADDTGRGDATDGGGWMLVVPAERVADLWRAVGRPDDLRRAAFTIDRAGAEAVGGALVEVDGGGDYALDAEGRSLLCRLPAQGSTRGCAEIDLPASGSVVSSFGEGGFVAWVED